MYGVCLQYAGNADDAKDIMQDGFIKVFSKIDQYTGKGSFEGWIRRILVNTALEKIRSRVNLQSIDEYDNANVEMFDQYVLESMTAEEISQLIQNLSPKYRLVFNLYALEGFSHKDISEKLGISEGTSKSNLSRARSILQQKVVELFSERERKDE
ncbi:MAG: RNA polymerase sigma factor [Bacteroidales bacterium]|nr:RNA polymerase sigma factor [Bacteroidales bacterium]MCF8389452.1 RNA polymerase sigma factor [Bacteroidales bacterium]